MECLSLEIFLLFLMFDLTACTGVATLRTTKFQRESAFDGHTCDSVDNLFTEDVENTFNCVIKCVHTSLCVTVFYDSTDGKCYGCVTAYINTSPLIISHGSIHYQLYPSCDEGWVGYMRSCYKLTTKGSFSNGAGQCQADGGHAVWVETSVENEFIKEFLKHDTDNSTWSWYLGINNCDVDDEWIYYDTVKRVQFFDFRSPAPEVFSECCAVFYSEWDYQWSDFQCDRPGYPWATVCEINADF